MRIVLVQVGCGTQQSADTGFIERFGNLTQCVNRTLQVAKTLGGFTSCQREAVDQRSDATHVHDFEEITLLARFGVYPGNQTL